MYSSSAYAGFGEQYGTSGSSDASFTGQNQDTVSSLFDFLARRQSPSQGRWILPDPAGLAAVALANPQSWNRYAYVTNNPLAMIDPAGLFAPGPALLNPPSDDDPGGFGGGQNPLGGATSLSARLDMGCFHTANCGAVRPKEDDNCPPGVDACVSAKITPCDDPPAPPGVAANQSVDANITTTFSWTYNESPAIAMAEWSAAVAPGGEWDYTQYSSQCNFNGCLNYDLYYGNFNYGATCFIVGLSLQDCQRGAGAEDYSSASVNYATGKGWTAGPGNPFTGDPGQVNGQPGYYGDQTGWAEGPAVAQGYTYAQQGCDP